jgi:hypothetical protein
MIFSRTIPNYCPVYPTSEVLKYLHYSLLQINYFQKHQIYVPNPLNEAVSSQYWPWMQHI